ncbi:NADH:flavin oxidoreductase [Desulfitobacterium sp. Sab5]|uniref:NADH:flavin oxidoreductase n=1 Tax=Desulfitobacterium nosdiversum TaxID=3375356 RepID=UPI003CF7B05B
MIKALEPIQFKNIGFKNRIVRSATMDPLGNHDGTISEAQYNLYETLANNNIGLIIGGQIFVTPVGRVGLAENAMCDDRYIDCHKKMVDIVHKAGTKIVAQISHCGAASMSINGNPPVAPSPIPYAGSSIVPRELTIPQIDVIIQQFIDAAERCKKIGYDGIQVHCAHQYLLSEFVNPVYNKRNDEYGGSIENRFKITEKIIIGIVKELGDKYPVFLKINSNIEENDEDYYKDLVYVAQKCKEMGVEAIEYSGYNFTPLGRKGLHNYYMERVSAVRKEVDIPAVLVGGIRNFKDIDEIIGSGIEMVSLSRPFICEPDLVTRLISGQEETQCTSCSKCFYLYKKEGRRCIFHEKK